MATTVKLTRQNAAQPWGFRIHGGRDFNQPIIVLKVTAGTLAASSGLTPGDQIASINGRDAGSLNHKDAENLIKNAGNEVAIGVYKANQSTWKPNVTVLTQPTANGGESGSVLVNKQFNTPIAMYSEQSIAETLSAQAEVLAGGAIGVNFKKNEKKYNYENSEVYKMLQEAESDRGEQQQQQQQQGDSYNAPSVSPGRTSASFVTNQNVPYANVLNRQQQFQPVVQQQIQQQQQIPQQQPIQQQQQSPAPAAAAPIQQVTAPTTTAPAAAAPGGSNPNVCADCERLIVGVFVRIKDKNLHVDCFKCSTCGQSLKNVGYFNINNKLYCDIHAKTVARQNPPAPGLEPLTTLKSPQLPTATGAAKPFSYTAAAPGGGGGGGMSPLPPLDSFTSLASKNIAPLPYQHSPSSGGISHVTAPKSPQQQYQPMQQQPLQQQPLQQPLQQQIVPLQQQQQQQLIQQSSSSMTSSSSYQESVNKSSSSSFESTSQGGVSKVTWPPADIVPSSPLPSKQQQQQQQKFKQPHVPYQPLASLLQPAASAAAAPQQQQQQPKFSPVAAPPQQQQQQQFAPFQPAPPPAAAAAPIQFSPIMPPQQQQQFAPPPQQQSAPLFAPQQQQQSAAPIGRPLPVFPPTAPAPGPAAINAASKNTTTSSTLASRIGRGILTQPGGPRVAVCGACQKQIRGPFVTAGLKFYCPDHFKCANGSCGRDLMEIGFVEEGANLYCEFCWEAHIAPQCGKCGKRIKNECIKAIGRDFHPQCFTCKQCNRAFGKDPFFLEDGDPFCQADWNEMFTTKCHGCGFPIEAGDRWVEAMSNNYHSQCFNCSACKKNLEGQSFFAKAGRPFCKSHAR